MLRSDGEFFEFAGRQLLKYRPRLGGNDGGKGPPRNRWA
jgi:hypothetical protein